MAENMSRKRIKVEDVLGSRFYQLPKFLIHDVEFKGLSNDAKVLYAIMRDRHDLSLKNGWVDDDGCVYMYYSRTSMMEDLQLCDKSITKAVKDLIKYRLIEESRQGQGKPNIIYVLTVSLDSHMTRKMYDSKTVESTSLEPKKIRPNDTKEIDTEISETKNKKTTTTASGSGLIVDPPTVNELEIYEAFKNSLGKAPNNSVKLQIKGILRHQDSELIIHAIQKTAGNNKEWNYAKSMLNNWKNDGILTIHEQIKREDRPKT